MNYFKTLNGLKPAMRLFNRAWPYLKAGGPALFLIMFIAIHIAIWIYGPKIELNKEFPLASVTARLLCSIVFTLFCVVIIGFFQKKEMTKYYNQKKVDELLASDPKARYIERQQFELDRMIKQIKHDFKEENYLYKLPWYLVVGLDSSGKTSLINRSGQEFLFTSALKASKMISENPVSCNWWISNNAILIDPDGKLLSQPPAPRMTIKEYETAINDNAVNSMLLKPDEKDPEITKHLWLHFLNWIKNVRAQRPLNGIIFTVDIPYIANANIHNRKIYASILRSRMRDIMESLSSRLPVYIVLTKLDLLNGFNAFFKHFTKAQREEVFGFTFTLKSYNEPDAWLEEFETEFSAFMKRINNILPKLLMQTNDKQERHEIYSFTRQLAGLNDILHLFLKESLFSDKFSTSPIIRGVYLTSVYQQGMPDDVFINAAAKRYRFNPMITSVQNNQNSIPFFTHQLFDKIILKESGLATDNLRLQEKNRRRLVTTGIFGSLSAVISVMAFNYFYVKNSNSVDKVHDEIIAFKKIDIKDNVDPTGRLLEAPLNIIRSATLEFGDFHNRIKYISDTGLYLGGKVGPEVEETYLQLLAYRYLPALISGVAKKLEEAPANSDEQLELLRVFRMLVDKKARIPEFVTDYFGKYWQESFVGNRTLQENLMHHLEYALKYTDISHDRSIKVRKAEETLSPYDSLILKAQKDLEIMPMEQRVYRSLKQHGITTLGASLDLRIEVGPAFDLIFDIAKAQEQYIRLPALFTKNGLEKYYLTRSENISELAIVDNWVIGRRNDIDFSEEDKIILRQKLREQYSNDYENYWRTSLNALNIKDFQDLDHGILILDNIINTSQPFQRLLASVKANTKLFPTMPENDTAREVMIKSTIFMIASQVDLSFANLNEITKITTTQLDKPTFLEEVLASIRNLHSLLKYIQGSQDVGQVALKVAKERLQLTDADPIFALKRIAERLPQPLDHLINKLADEAWNVILIEAIKEIDRRWHNIVYEEFNTVLANKFPFNSQSNVDVSLEEFEHFFGKEGTVNQFYDGDLKLFLEESLFKNKGHDTYKTLILPEVIAQLEASQKIRNAFFNQRGVLGVEFTLAPLSMGPQMRRSVLNIEGQYIEYLHGSRRGSALIWPNTINSKGEETVAKLTMIPTKPNQPQSVITFKGPWALFRMLNQGQVTSLEQNKLQINFTINGVGMKYELVAQGEINPFTASILQNFRLSPSLYK